MIEPNTSGDERPLAETNSGIRKVMSVVLGAFYFAAGTGHFLATDSLVRITPDWVPWPREVILATGAFEIAAALALFVPPLRKIAGSALALYALCVWPANFKHAFYGIDLPSLPSTWWYHAPRLAMQPLIIWWALYASGVIDWPRRRNARNR